MASGCLLWFLVLTFFGSCLNEFENEVKTGEVNLQGTTKETEGTGIGNIADENKEETGQTDDSYITEGDIIYTQEEWAAQNQLHDKRSFTMFDSLKWANNYIPWRFNLDERKFKSSKSFAAVKVATRHWEEYTCLKFINLHKNYNEYHLKRLSGEINHDSVLEFGLGSGCSSFVGFKNMTRQPIFLWEPGCTNPGTIVHEIAHAVGFYHQQSRIDRDDSVTVHWDNILDKAKSCFDIMDHSVNLTPYDLGSTMHYGEMFFSSNGKPTITPRDTNLSFLLGQRNGLSFYDVMAIHAAFNCTDGCENRDNDRCSNGGFVFKYPTCECLCPTGLAGPTCDDIDADWVTQIRQGQACGQIIVLQPGQGITLKSPNFPQPYRQARCIWLVKASDTQAKLLSSIVVNNVPVDTIFGHCAHWVEIRYNLMGQNGPRYCGSSAIKDLPASTTNMLLIRLDGSDDRYTGQSFTVNINILGSHGTNETSQVSLTNVHTPCQMGEVVVDQQKNEPVCSCYQGYEGVECENVRSAHCDFHSGLCFLHHIDDKDVKWVVNQVNMGPPFSCPGCSGQHLMLLPDDDPQGLVSNYVVGSPKCLEVVYFTAGINPSDFQLRLKKDNSNSTVVVPLGQNAHNWVTVRMNITVSSKFKFTVEGKLTDPYTQMIVLRDINLDEGYCKAKSTVTSYSVCLDYKKVFQGSMEDTILFSCDFEKGTCGMENISGEDLHFRQVTYVLFGPYYDRHGKYGTHFIAEGSYDKKPNMTASMVTPLIDSGCGYVCLTFWYYVLDYNFGSVRIYRVSNGNETEAWQMAGDFVYRPWTKVDLNIFSTEPFQIKIVRVPAFFWGSFAMDDVIVRPGSC